MLHRCSYCNLTVLSSNADAKCSTNIHSQTYSAASKNVQKTLGDLNTYDKDIVKLQKKLKSQEVLLQNQEKVQASENMKYIAIKQEIQRLKIGVESAQNSKTRTTLVEKYHNQVVTLNNVTDIKDANDAS